MTGLAYGLLLLGAIGLFLAMPGGRVSVARVGWVLLAAAAGVLVSVFVKLGTGGTQLGWFGAFTLIGLFAALRVITHRKPVYSAVYFILLIVSIAGLLLLMDANFLATALVIVYGGAILVTYVFVIMLAQQARPAVYDTKSREPFWGCLAGFALLGLLTLKLLAAGETADLTDVALPAGSPGNVIEVSRTLLTDYIIAIQLVGLLLLAAMVGAIAIARRQATTDTQPMEGDEQC
jgi:NADH-quinone oxidoreductase subunit J